MYNKHKIWKSGDKPPTATYPVCTLLESVWKDDTEESNGIMDGTENRGIPKS